MLSLPARVGNGEIATSIAAFSGLQFSVSASTDETWRAELVDDVVAEVQEALAVRARCLAGSAGEPPADAPPI